MVRHTPDRRERAAPMGGLWDTLCNNALINWLSSFLEDEHEEDEAYRHMKRCKYQEERDKWGYLLNEDGDERREREAAEERKRHRTVTKLQSSVRCVIAKKKYDEFISKQNPPLSLITSFAHCLNPHDTTFDVQLRVNKLNVDLTSKSKSLRQDWQVFINVEKDIEALIKCNMAHQDLLSRFKELGPGNKEQVKEAIAKHRQETCEARKKRERIISYGHLFYYLKTNPVYLTRLMNQMTSYKDIKTFADKVLFQLYDYGSTPQEEYHFVKLMEFALRKEVEEKIVSIEDISFEKSQILKLIKYFYTERRKYKHILTAMAPGIHEILRVIDPLACTEVPSTRLGRFRGIFKKKKRTEGDLYALTNTLIKAIFTSVDKIPYGLRYLTKVLHESLLNKFPHESKDSLLWPVGYFLSEYFCTAMVETDQFGFGLNEGSNQRRNLVYVFQVFRTIMESFAPYRTLKSPGLDEFIRRKSNKLRGFFGRVLKAPDLETEFSFTKYADALRTPRITMHAEDIIYVHSLLSKYEDVVFCDQGLLPTKDFAYQVYKDIGPVPLLEDLESTYGAIADKKNKTTRVPFCLFSKDSPLEDVDVEMEKAKISSIKLALEHMLKRPEEKLLESLIPTQKMDDQTVLGGKTSTSAEDAHKQEKSHSTKVHDASQESMSQIRAKNLQLLQKAGYFTEAGSEQEFYKLLCKEITQKHELRDKRNEELKVTKKAFDDFKETNKMLQDLTDLHKKFRKSCMDNLVGENVGIPGIQRIHYTEDYAVYTAKELFQKGVIVNPQGDVKAMKREFITIKAIGEELHVNLDSKCEKIQIMDMIYAHHSSNPTMKIFHYDVDLGMFLFLVCSHFIKTFTSA